MTGSQLQLRALIPHVGEEKLGNREGKVCWMTQDIELGAFKREIDLRQFAE